MGVWSPKSTKKNRVFWSNFVLELRYQQVQVCGLIAACGVEEEGELWLWLWSLVAQEELKGRDKTSNANGRDQARARATD